MLPVRVVVATLAVVGSVVVHSQTRPVPLGLSRYMRVPADNPLTDDKVRLGRRLFFDTRLSEDESLSCATCHQPERAFADDKVISVGIHGRHGTRNVPTLVNRGYGEFFFWDGRATTLEAQVLQPILNPNELGSTIETVVDRLRRDDTYVAAFHGAFGRGVNETDLARALASYVRSIASGDTPVDRYQAGDEDALTAEARLGMRVFAIRGLCTTCHVGPTMTDERFHNTGVAWDLSSSAFADDGRFVVTGDESDRGAFRTPTLRDVARTAPYMHDGSIARLEDVIEFYDGGGRANPNLDADLLPLGLSEAEKAGLLAFLRALDGSVVDGSTASRRP